MGVNGEALQLHVIYKKPYFILQVTPKSVSGVTCAASERAMKLNVCMIKIIIKHQATSEKITRLLPLALLLVLYNNTDRTLYYGDTYTCIAFTV